MGEVRRAPRARSANRSPHCPPRASIFRCRRRLSLPPGSNEPSAFHRVSQRPPLRRVPSVSTPASLRPLRPGRCQAPCSFRPRRSSRPRRFSPLMESRACCVPHPTMRFIGFPRTDDACLRRRRASSPMPALQSFSLPRSGPRVTARSCPPVVGRQRQLDSGALIRSEIRCAEHSWPSPDARCSPGLPCLEPHSIAFTSASARERATQEVRLGPAQARAGRVAESAMSASPRPEGRSSARTRGGGWIGRGITTTHAIPRVRDRLRRRRSGVLAGHFPRGRWSSSTVDPTAPRRIVGQPPARLARRRACRVSTRGVPGPSAW